MAASDLPLLANRSVSMAGPIPANRTLEESGAPSGREATSADAMTQPARIYSAKRDASGTPSDWYYFGPPATIVKRQEIAQGAVTLVTLSNGVRVALRPSKIENEVVVQVEIDGGLRSLSLSSQPAAALGQVMFVESGVGRKTREELVDKFGPAASSIEFNMYDTEFAMTGEGESKDLEALCQVITAYLADPAWRPQSLIRAKNAEIESWGEYRKWPHIWLNAQVKALFLGGDPRWSIPTTAEIEATSIEDVKDAIGERLATGAVDITIAGDFEVSAALANVAATFGALPARPSIDVQPIRPPSLVAHTARPYKVFHHGDKEKVAGYIAWPMPDTSGQERTKAKLSLMKKLLLQRVATHSEFRAEFIQGIPNAMPGYWGISVLQSGDIEQSYSIIRAEASRLSRDRVTQDELEPARGYLLKVVRDLQDKQNMASAIALFGTKGDSVRVEGALNFVNELEGITPEEVQEVASEFLRDDTFIAATAYPYPEE